MSQRQNSGETGPLLKYGDGFRKHLEDRGNVTDSSRWWLRQLTALDRSLHECRVAASDLDDSCVDRLVVARQAAHRTTFVAAANLSVPIARVFAPARCGSSSDLTFASGLTDS